MFRTLLYSELEEYLESCQASIVQHFLRTLCKSGTFRILEYAEAEKILRSLSSVYDTFKTLAYSELKTFKIPWIFKTQFVTLTYSQPPYIHALVYWEPKKYCRPFSTKPCVTVTYSELETYLKPWHIQNSRQIHNTVKYLPWNISFKTLCNPEIFRVIVYSQLWYILKSKHIQSVAEYLWWSIVEL